MNLLDLLLILLGIILGVVVGYFLARNILHQKQIQARQTANDIIKQGQKKQIISKREIIRGKRRKSNH